MQHCIDNRFHWYHFMRFCNRWYHFMRYCIGDLAFSSTSNNNQERKTDLILVTFRTINKSPVRVVPKYTRVGQRLADTYTRKTVMKVLSEVDFFERLIDYGRNKLATDVDDYAIERLLQSDFKDSGNKAPEADKSLLDNLYHFQNP